MLLPRTERLPEGPDWAYELKLDGYRALAFKSYGAAHLRSRNNKSFDSKYPAIVQSLAHLRDETVIDGEVVAIDESGRPSFNALQNGSATRSSATTSLTCSCSRAATLWRSRCPRGASYCAAKFSRASAIPSARHRNRRQPARSDLRCPRARTDLSPNAPDRHAGGG
jgi:hypothetical protein